MMHTYVSELWYAACTHVSTRTLVGSLNHMSGSMHSDVADSVAAVDAQALASTTGAYMANELAQLPASVVMDCFRDLLS